MLRSGDRIMCEYCALKFHESIMARAYFDEINIRWYCPKCLEEVKDNIRQAPWLKQPIVSYPFKQNKKEHP